MSAHEQEIVLQSEAATKIERERCLAIVRRAKASVTLWCAREAPMPVKLALDDVVTIIDDAIREIEQ